MPRPCFRFAVIFCLIGFFATTVSRAETQSDAAQILTESGITGGFVVHLGAGDGELAAAIGKSPTIQVHGLVRDAESVANARKTIQRTKAYGEVSIDRLDGDQLPYVDNLVNLLVTEDLGDISMDEVLRVLVPNGVALVKEGDDWKKTIKP